MTSSQCIASRALSWLKIRIPDEITIQRFRHLLEEKEEKELTAAIFAEVRTLPQETRLLFKSGTIVDATIISAPSSTKNAARDRGPATHRGLKNQQWYFGKKGPVGTSKQGLVHSVATGPAHDADIIRLDDLLHGQEDELYGNQAYWCEDHRQHCRQAGIRYHLNRCVRNRRKLLIEYQKTINRSRSRRRAHGEFAFHMVKRLWGFAKARYHGLAKNTARGYALFALANLYLVRRRLLPRGACCAL